MGLLTKISPLLACIWRKAPQWLRGVVTWTINGKLIVGVTGVLLTDSDQILLLRHRFHHTAFWGLPGGWLSPGETIFDCWRREVREELALDVLVEEIVCHRATPRTLEFFLLGRVDGGQLKIDPVEIVEARYFTAEELPPMEKFHQLVIKQALRRRRDISLQTPISQEFGAAGSNPPAEVEKVSQDSGGAQKEELHA